MALIVERNIANRIYHKLYLLLENEIEPKYIYMGRDEYIKLKDTNIQLLSPAFNLYLSKKILTFEGLEIIEVNRQSHLNVTGG